MKHSFRACEFAWLPPSHASAVNHEGPMQPHVTSVLALREI